MPAPLRERILTLVPGGVGDQILFFPTLAGLRQIFPQAEIEVMVEPRAAGAYEVCPSVDHVLTFGFKEQLTLADLSDLLGRIRERQYDLVLALGRSLWLKVMLWLTGIPKRIGYAPPGPGDPWLTHPVPLKSEQYAAAMYQDLLQGLGYTLPLALPQIQLKKSALDWCETERKRLFGDPSANYVLIHPGASQLSVQKGIHKIYPVPQWIQIIEAFRQKRPDLPVVVLGGGPDDEALIQAFKQQLPDLPITFPKQVGPMAGMIAGATSLLCTDSAPMHLAVATQTPLLALFGPTDPGKLLPKEGPYRVVKSKDGQIDSIPASQVIETIFPS